MMPAIAPGGERIALTQVDSDRQLDLWLLDPRRGSMVRLVNGGKNAHSSVWTPDGRQLAFTSDHDGPSNLYLKPVDSGEPPTRLTVSDRHHDAGSFSPDGSILTFAEMHPITNWDLWFHNLTTGASRPFLNTEAEEIQAIVSPGGEQVAYTSNETGRREIYLERFPGGGGKQVVSTSGGEDPVWSADGHALYYRWEDRINVTLGWLNDGND